ncbi:mannan-binding lectin serine protease 2-like isoform X2 [Oscarella lobularis]
MGFQAHYEIIDINECRNNNGDCLHFCHNCNGGYYCSCRHTDILASDGKTCIPLNQYCQNRTIIGKPGERGEVKSPMYPKKYENNLNCSWTIIFPYGYNIELRFLDIDIEAHSEANCPYDKLEVADDSGDVRIYCGTSGSLPATYLSQNIITIRFLTDESTTYRGFQVEFYIKVPVCSDPGVPENGTKEECGGKEGFDYAVGAFVHYYCDKGFLLNGSKTIKCEKDPTWNDTRPVCQRVSCGNPGQPDHGTTTLTGGIERTYVYEDQVTSACDDYYKKAYGNYRRNCTENGTWSGEALKCKPVCGERTFYPRGQIIGGETVAHGAYPWMALLYDDPCRSDRCAFCGGVILNNKYILTAAHCLVHKGTNFVVRLGVNKRTQNNTVELWCKPKKVFNLAFNPDTFQSDVLLIQINYCTPTVSDTRYTEIVLSKYIRPICLPEESDRSFYEVNDKIKVAGWGNRNVFEPRQSVKLRHAILAVADRDSCQAHFDEQGWKIHNDMFCTVASGGKDVCNGDSGGPVMVKNNLKKFVIVGIVSWGDKECGTGYGVYSDVLYHIKWIKKTSRYDDYC